MSKQQKHPSPKEAEILELVASQGILRARDLRSRGLSVAYLQRLLAKGMIVQLGRGQYTLPDREPTEHDTLATTANLYPGSVICLLTALRFHELTTQSPRAIWLAVEGTKMAPSKAPATVEVVRISGPAFHRGVGVHKLGQVPVQIYDPGKTVVDCFKFRNRVGMDVAIEALKECLSQRQATPDQIWSFAEMCRVKTIIKPYLEAFA